MTLKYTAKRPDEAFDALQDLETDWTHPTQEPAPVYVVARVVRTGIAKPTASGDWTATAGLAQVEIIDPVVGEKMLRDSYQARSGGGQPQLDLDGPAEVAPAEKTATVTDLPVKADPMWEPDPDSDGAA